MKYDGYSCRIELQEQQIANPPTKQKLETSYRDIFVFTETPA